MKKIEVEQNNLLKLSLKERKLLDNLIKKARLEKIPVLSKHTGSLLEIICITAKPENVLEIGCGIGFSSYFIIKHLEKGNYTGIDLNKERAKRAETFIKSKFTGRNCRFIAGNALKIVPEIKDKFDMVFIDGAKHEYPLYFKTLEDKLNPGALVIADNVFYKGRLFEKKINKHDFNSVNGIREYIKYITGSKCFKSYFIDIGDGISVTKFLSNCHKKNVKK
jgi:predicted O-methyltransferase YrrM